MVIISIPQKIKKRDGRIVDFDIEKISTAISKAMEASGRPNRKVAKELADKVVNKLVKKHKKSAKFIPAIEEIQDSVEEALIEGGYAKVAKNYILYRQKRAEIRQEKKKILDKEEIDEIDKRFDVNALRVLRSRYLRKDEKGKVIESPKELFERVALHAGLPEIIYDSRVTLENPQISAEKIEDSEKITNEEAESLAGKLSVGKYKLNQFHIKGLHYLFVRFEKNKQTKISWQELVEMLHKDEFKKHEKTIDEFCELMVSRHFMPNTPALANFGSYLGMGSACFALDIDDSIESIMDTLRDASVIFKSGGGLGYNFSKLRPEGDFIKTTGGAASGPISFMRLFDTMTEVVKQGGIRRGANMGILNSNHPDIEKFITAKQGNKALKNFNISVLVMPDFWDYYKKNSPYPLVNPRTKKPMRFIGPRFLFEKIAYQAWESAEPGVLFYDHINKYNPFLKTLGPIVTTNPCVAGDTLVAVADGRNYVSIRQLAAEGKDVPVYCYGNGEVRIGMGRNPRKTRENVPVWKVILDDESYIIATEDHKFRTRNNNEIKLSDLKPGDSLMPFYKFQYSPTKKRISYWGVAPNNNKRAQAEHRMIAEFYLRKKLKKYPHEVVHHINFNGLDNRICNLEILSQGKHDSLHQTGEINVMKGKWWRKLSEEEKEIYRQKMAISTSGEKNGMYGKKHNTETRRKISQMIRIYYQDPKNKSEHAKLMKKLLSNPLTREKISIALTKYNYISLECLNCGKKIIEKENKPTKFCSHSCAASFIDKLRDTTKLKETIFKKNQQRRKMLYDLGIEFLSKNNHPPNYSEFRKFASEHNINGDVRSCFGGFQRFKEEIGMYNHKVISIEFYGHEDVYNITVDEFHTVAYITNPNTRTKSAKKLLLSGIITSQCGELLLYPNESCNLGSINVLAFIKSDAKERKSVDWPQLAKAVRAGVRFLDNIIDINQLPLKAIEDMTFKTRKIGLGLMGLGDLLYVLKIPFNSGKGREFMEKLMEFINYHSKTESVELAKERGAFPYFDKSFYAEGRLPFGGFDDKKSWHFDWEKVANLIKDKGIRNTYTTVIAPTGSISMIAGCSSGVEPVYSLAFQKNVSVGSFYFINPVFEKEMLKEGLFDDVLIQDIVANKGSIKGVNYIPKHFKRIFVTSYDITPEDHIRTLAAFQKWVDASVSKTNNFPAKAAADDMKKSYLLAYELGCKGVTVFRDTSITDQVLVAAGEKGRMKEEEKTLIRIKDEKAEGMAIYRNPFLGGRSAEEGTGKDSGEPINGDGQPMKCPACGSELVKQEGCTFCPVCGWGLCV